MYTRLVTLSALFVALCAPCIGADPQLEVGRGTVPDSVPASLKDQLQTSSLRVQVDGKLLGEFWMRKELPAAPTANSALGVNFGAISQRDFAGVVQFPESWSDYKGQMIPAGVYSLRYEVEPADGNHMGVSSYRDFLLLVPIAEDKDVDTKYTYEQLVELSRKASGTNHPAVLALFPVTEQVSEAKLTKNDLDQWTLAVPLGSTQLGIVLIGAGSI